MAVAVGSAERSSAGMGPPRVAAHRGGALLWPENSLLAFRNALALGVDFIECDVHLTADREAVVLHDGTLDRTTTGRGAVGKARLADLAPLRLKAGGGGGVTDEPIPTLGQLLNLLGTGRTQLLLEIKVGAGGRRYPGIEETVLGLLRARRLESRVLLMAFESDTLRRLRDLDPALRTVLLIGRQRLPRGGPAAMVLPAAQLGAHAVGVSHASIDAGLVAAARQAGLVLAAWTVNEEADIRHMIQLGVDVVISDRPDLVKRLLGR